MRKPGPAFEFVTERCTRDDVIRLKCFSHRRALSFADVVDYWQSSPSFARRFNDQLAETPFAAYFWEIPPQTIASADRPFECVMVNSPQLAAVAADSSQFAAYFADRTATVSVFPNIGHDAWLIAPVPMARPEAYPHLAAFVRLGPASQQLSLWQMVGQTVSRQLCERPVWLSTSGLGVPWLHMRLDSRPKYYSWRPYKTFIN